MQLIRRTCQFSKLQDGCDELQRRDRWFEIFHLSLLNIRFDTWLFSLNSKFMKTKKRIGILGDYNPDNPTHMATNEGIQHAAELFSECSFESSWLATDQQHQFSEYQGLLCSPGSPYRSLEGTLHGIQCAREQKIPFLGTCGGSQHLVLEYARNVMGIREAAHAETDPYASCLFITPLSCSLAGTTMEVRLKPGTQAAAIYRDTRVTERFYCNFGLNPAYQDQLVSAGLEISGTDQAGEARVMELPTHPFFIGTLFVPQANSAKRKPHPIVLAFLGSVARRRRS
jgi:CTP synthase (UTP-ammonia lyase)